MPPNRIMQNRLSGINPLAYLGSESYTPPSIWLENRAPTFSDSEGYRIGDEWFVSGTQLVYFLVGLDNASPIGRATWVQLGGGGGGTITFHTQSGDAVPLLNVLNVYGGLNITATAVVGIPNTITISMNNSINVPGNLTINALSNGILTVGPTGVVSASNGTAGQVPIGGGVAPMWATITSPDNSITFIPGANTLGMQTTQRQFNGLVGQDGLVAVPDPTDFQIGMAGDSNFLITSVPVPNILQTKFFCPTDPLTTGSVPISNATTGIPVWSRITGSGGIVVTWNDGAINIAGGGGGGGGLVGIIADDPSIATLDANNRIALHGLNGTLETICDTVLTPHQVDIAIIGGNDGQVLIANTGTGIPVWATPTTIDGSVTITAGAGTFDVKTTSPQFAGIIDVYDATATPDAIAHKIGFTGDVNFIDGVCLGNAFQAKMICPKTTPTGGYIPISNHTTGVPVWGLVTGSGGIVITAGDGTLNIAGGGGGGGGLVGMIADDTNTATLDGNSKITVHGKGLLSTSVAGGTPHQLDFTLAPGTAGQFLTTNIGGIPAWTTIGIGAQFNGLRLDDNALAAPDPASHEITLEGDGIFIKTGQSVPFSAEVSLTGGCDKQVIGGIGVSPNSTGRAWKTLTSAGNTVTITSTNTTINLEAVGGGAAGANNFVTPSGTAIAYAGSLFVYNGTNCNASAHTTTNANDTLIIDLNQVIYWPNTNTGGTAGVIYLGGNRYFHNYGTNNTWLGQNSGSLTLTTGSSINNVGIGTNALNGITAGLNDTVAIGYNAMQTPTISSQRTVAIGSGALNKGGGGANIGIGYNALLVADNVSTSNVAIGVLSMDAMKSSGGFSPRYNIGLGNSTLGAATGASYQIAIGESALGNGVLTGSGVSNIAIGPFAGYKLTGTGCVLIGGSTGATTSVGTNMTTAIDNIVIGGTWGNANSVTTGSYNTIISGGTNYTGGAETSNILISNPGVTGENNAIHIGVQGTGSGMQKDKTYVAGIYGAPVATGAIPVFVDSTGKLGTGNATYLPAFLAVQTIPVANVTGDDTVYYLGSSAVMSVTPTTGYDLGGNVYPGSGSGAPCTFTAPFKGLYSLQITTLITDIYAQTPPPPPPPVLFHTPLTIETYTAGGVLYRSYNLWRPVITYQGTGYPNKSNQSIFYSIVAFMDVGYVAKFSVSIYYLNGTKTLGVGTYGGTSIDTFVNGSLISVIP